MDMPKKNLAASNRSCNIPVGICVHGKPLATLSPQHGVRFMMGHARPNTKSTYGREGLTSHFTRTTENRRMCVQSCHARKACPGHASSHQAVGIAYGYINYCIATQPADYSNYLISKVCVCYFLKIP